MTLGMPMERSATLPAQSADVSRGGERRYPIATYRVQFTRDFTFADARRIVSYLRRLGCDTLYASPFLKPREGSAHGYDVVNHSELNPALGTREDFEALATELRACEMGQILDVVPNHVGIGPGGSSWWTDILENGPSSQFAAFFDIDWHPLKTEAALENRVLLPILGSPYGQVLENQELVLTYEDGAFGVRYWENRLPISPSTYSDILSVPLPDLIDRRGSDDQYVQELQSIITASQHLPPSHTIDPDMVAERSREKEIIKRRIAQLCESCPDVRDAIDQTLALFNGVRGDQSSFDRLDALLDTQPYRLAYWRVASEEINYRRFFDINDLAAIRMENPDVFAQTHRLIFDLLRDGMVTGLRIDHVDGLWDPPGYLRQLQRHYFLEVWRKQFGGTDAELEQAERTVLTRFDAEQALDPDASAVQPLYVVVEKILSRGEQLPDDWPVDGTTGYDFLSDVNGLFVDASSRKAFDDTYAAFVEDRINMGNLANSTKKMIMLISLASEVNELSYRLKRLAQRSRWSRDLTLNSLTFAIREVIAALPIYRTYYTDTHPEVTESDRDSIESAVAEARRRNPRTAAAVFDFVRDSLLLWNLDTFDDDGRRELRNFVMKFQQTTSPVMAKGVEDTAFYVYNRLVSLNDVGGHPEEFGTSIGAFHAANSERLASWPTTLLATSTHDTKRSEDVRARISVLSEIPREWRAAVTRWARQNRRKKTIVGSQSFPDANAEYALYQNLLGAWPLESMNNQTYETFVERMQQYVLKAAREAKIHTSWINPNSSYDDGIQNFVRAILEPSKGNQFLSDFARLQPVVAYYGMLNSLAQVLLKITSPGVPDIYQGNELWDFSLVDPDNRRPVDFERRSVLLEQVREMLATTSGARVASELLANWENGAIKLFVTWCALDCRQRDPHLFTRGGYTPLEATSRGDHVVSFARSLGAARAIVVAPRLCHRLTRGTLQPPLGENVWHDSHLLLPDEGFQRYRDAMTGEQFDSIEYGGRPALLLSRVLEYLPVALLERLPG
jgi:(1->4)-alpha-D-glucan 1-alpha-D-glucosylmutase